MKLYAITPNTTGPNSYYVMSNSVEEAIESLKKILITPWRLDESKNDTGYDEYIKCINLYKIEEFDINQPTCSDNC